MLVRSGGRHHCPYSADLQDKPALHLSSTLYSAKNWPALVHKWPSVVSYAPLSVRTLDLICFLCKPSAQPLDLMVQVLHFLFTLQVSIIANLPICN